MSDDGAPPAWPGPEEEPTTSRRSPRRVLTVARTRTRAALQSGKARKLVSAGVSIAGAAAVAAVAARLTALALAVDDDTRRAVGGDGVVGPPFHLRAGGVTPAVRRPGSSLYVEPTVLAPHVVGIALDSTSDDDDWTRQVFALAELPDRWARPHPRFPLEVRRSSGTVVECRWVNVRSIDISDGATVHPLDVLGPGDDGPPPLFPPSVRETPDVDTRRPPTPAAGPVEPGSSDEDELEAALHELDDLIGLSRVKDEVRAQLSMLAMNQRREAAGFKVVQTTRHMVFSGNPGTGKTEVARLVARIYCAMGALSTGVVVESGKTDFVAGFVGQSELKTMATIERALGGVLFIDEAYSLAERSGWGFGEEAINVLVKEMEDHREDLVVIAAGYPDRMDEFLGANAGLESRFKTTIHFDDYTALELVAILEKMASDRDYSIDPAALDVLLHHFDDEVNRSMAPSAREARNIVESAVKHHAGRRADDIRHVTVVDVTAACEERRASRSKHGTAE